MSNPNEGMKDVPINPAMTGGEKGISGSDKIRSFSNPNKDKREPSRGFESKMENKMEDFGDTIKDQSQYITSEVASLVRRNPWAVVGGASIITLGLGFWLGRKSTSTR